MGAERGHVTFGDVAVAPGGPRGWVHDRGGGIAGDPGRGECEGHGGKEVAGRAEGPGSDTRGHWLHHRRGGGREAGRWAPEDSRKVPLRWAAELGRGRAGTLGPGARAPAPTRGQRAGGGCLPGNARARGGQGHRRVPKGHPREQGPRGERALGAQPLLLPSYRLPSGVSHTTT